MDLADHEGLRSTLPLLARNPFIIYYKYLSTVVDTILNSVLFLICLDLSLNRLV